MDIHIVAHLFRTDPQLLIVAIGQTHLDFDSLLTRFERNEENVNLYPLGNHWKNAGTICRQLLALRNLAGSSQALLREHLRR
jgi:hypothetical protein